MKITFNPNILMTASKNTDKKGSEQKIEYSEYSYNPIAYRDYNISFGQRLFRSPENFYEQDFNEKNMPKTLHDYIYTADENLSFKKTIPPAQAMEIVFENLNQAEDLDDVKIVLYPNEPLFKDLVAHPTIKSRDGVVGMLNLVKDDPEYQNRSLFTNGKNDLGIYILKKIYLEGKTFGEIKKDFSKDVSDYYSGFELTRRDYMAYGIKFPELSYWHSFLATRNDRNFHRVVIPKSPEEKPSQTSHSAPAKSVSPKTKKPRISDSATDWEIAKIGKTVAESGGDINKIVRQINKDKKPSPTNNFVAKYMSEIMSVTMERLHMSEEMRNFFYNYNNIGESNQNKLKKYWETPDMKENMSYVMKATIRMFMDAYDEDGENEVFKDLIEYANNIKSKRETEQLRHDKIQAEYDKLLEDFDMDAHLKAYLANRAPNSEPDSEQQAPATTTAPTGLLTPDEKLAEAKARGWAVKPIELKDGTKCVIAMDRKILVRSIIQDTYSMFPTKIQRLLEKDLTNNASDDFLLSVIVKNHGLDNFIASDSQGNEVDKESYDTMLPEIISQFMPDDEMKATARTLGDKSLDEHSQEYNAAKLAMFEFFNKIPFASDDYIKNAVTNTAKNLIKDEFLATLPDDIITALMPDKSIRDLSEIIKTAGRLLHSSEALDYTPTDIAKILQTAGIISVSDKGMAELNMLMRKYSKPLTQKEMTRLTDTILENMLNMDFSIDTLENDSNAKIMGGIWNVIKTNAQQPEAKKYLKNLIKENLINAKDGTLRCLIDDSVSEEVKKKFTLHLIKHILSDEITHLWNLATMDKKVLMQNRHLIDPEIFEKLWADTPN